MDGRFEAFEGTATVGRRQFLQRMGYAAAGLVWLQSGSMPAFGSDDDESSPVIRRGFDFMATTVAHQWIEVPASMLGPGMKAFEDIVQFGPSPIDPKIGNADTIMERMDDAVPGQRIRSRIVAFSNRSAQPIELRGTGAIAGEYYLYVTLSPTKESPGTMVFESDNGGVSGTFRSEVTLAPLFELRPVSGGSSLFLDGGKTPLPTFPRETFWVDTGMTDLPNFPMPLGSTGGEWTTIPTSPRAVKWRQGQSLYYPGELLIVSLGKRSAPAAQQQGSGHGDNPTPSLPPLVNDVLAACKKQQAELGLGAPDLPPVE